MYIMSKKIQSLELPDVIFVCYKYKICFMNTISRCRCLYIPLVEAERCWSYAMQLKAESVEDHRKKHHMVNKLRKAERYAQELSDLCEKVNVDPRTKLEVQVGGVVILIAYV